MVNGGNFLALGLRPGLHGEILAHWGIRLATLIPGVFQVFVICIVRVWMKYPLFTTSIQIIIDDDKMYMGYNLQISRRIE
jgi:hypothetical protein